MNNEQGGQAYTQWGDHTISTGMVTLLDSVSPAAEAYRRLQTNILYSNPDGNLKTLMVTSATQGEGKSTTIANLGMVLAEAGKEVLIVDTDLRRPNMHNMLGVRRSPGITGVLFEGRTWQETVQTTPRNRVSVLCAGVEPHNPSAVIQSEAFHNMLQELKQAYDMVLLDTPHTALSPMLPP